MFKPTTRHNVPAGPSSGPMDVKINRRPNGKEPSGRYPFRLNLYDRPPILDITLDEFETCALDRLRILSHIEALSHRNLPMSQYVQAVSTYLKTHSPLSSNTARNAPLDEERRRDEIGHWVLRLAFCRSPDLRSRFVRSELALFKHRFETDDANERAEFLRSLNFDWKKVDESEKRALNKELRLCHRAERGKEEESFRAESWFKVPWYTVPDLVASRKVYIKAGMAYVPQALQISLVLQAFGSKLEKALEVTAKNLPRLDEDERLGPVIDHLASSFLSGLGASDYEGSGEGASGEAITADMVDELAKKHFPACMRNLHETLKRDHHLKHFGRLQLRLFLKGIGLSLEEAIIYWRRMFGATMSDDKFNKEHRYNVRHAYGQEGRRMNYPPKNCQRILTQDQPGTQDSHGCPFRHMSPDKLSQFLVNSYPQLERSSPEMKEIMDSVKASHYHVACTRVFEITHKLKKGEGMGGPDAESVSHPNKYVDRSREIEKERMEAIKAKEEESQ